MMLRTITADDMDRVIQIWFESSIIAHAFADPEYWRSKTEAMRTLYIPNSETWVWEDDENIQGFLSLNKNDLAALFVLPEAQGHGIGTALMDLAKSLRDELTLAVYTENTRSVSFYRKQGFTEIREQTDEHTGRRELIMAWKK
ncbi:N-acetyltransferase [Breznakiella homolactica]|uniref:N-acetyltransferase n=1 Tax=Breznakiella homolactica TaxID=2798577 RepID=A0A7T8B9T1_9SPIR|nr:N-acetyltransferase [Breznakiella homolactica]QQO08807.1 N-acetyltransferase [Breznakiella homolactica]